MFKMLDVGKKDVEGELIKKAPRLPDLDASLRARLDKLKYTRNKRWRWYLWPPPYPPRPPSLRPKPTKPPLGPPSVPPFFHHHHEDF